MKSCFASAFQGKQFDFWRRRRSHPRGSQVGEWKRNNSSLLLKDQCERTRAFIAKPVALVGASGMIAIFGSSGSGWNRDKEQFAQA
jgi:hypothetical protein